MDSADIDQLQQCLHCFPLTKQFLDTSTISRMELFKFNPSPAEPGYTLLLQIV